MEVAAGALRSLNVTLPSALRWLRRRLRAVHVALDAVLRLASIAPAASFMMCAAPLANLRSESVLLWLRRAVAPQLLSSLPSPLGFLPAQGSARSQRGDQQREGRDEVFDSRYVVVTDARHQPCDTSSSIRSQRSAFRRPRICAGFGVPIAAYTTGVPADTCNG